MAADTSVLVAGGTYRFLLTATKDGTPWDLSSASVALYFRKPDGTALPGLAATVLSAAAGTAYYDSLTTDLTDLGQWARAWEVTDGAVVQRGRPVLFRVVASP
jgi:hypothetical protein